MLFICREVWAMPARKRAKPKCNEKEKYFNRLFFKKNNRIFAKIKKIFGKIFNPFFLALDISRNLFLKFGGYLKTYFRTIRVTRLLASAEGSI